MSMPDAAHELIDALRTSLRGDVIDRQSPEYDEARSVWNGLIDRRPAVVARCADAQDVVSAVNVARRYRPPVTIRGGGHQVAGSSVCDDGMVIDLSAMRGVEVDPAKRIARADGGATWGDVDRATQRFGLATTGGEVSTTGIGGFTLGGGMGLLMRAHGLACDNLRAVQVVTADGELRSASPEEHADLFWAACGGGRGIGVVTSFEFDLHPLGPDVAAATVFYPYEDARGILQAWREYAPTAPDSVSPQLVLWSVPPDPTIPEALHGAKTVVLTGLYAGPVDEADAVLAPLRGFGKPLFDASGTVPYVDLQSSLDELLPAGGRYFMKSHGFDELSDEAIETLLEWDAERPTPETLTAIRTLGGAIERVTDAESAFPHRADRFNLSIDAVWSRPADDDKVIGWARGAWDALARDANGGMYVNFAGLEDEAAASADRVFRLSRNRLAEVRATYDPTGLFDLAARRP
jgi:FAD/FMN-containing dehydrogenase